MEIAIIGSSGGNLYNLGGKEPRKLLGEFITQAESAGIAINDVVFVGAEASMDNITSKTRASLFTVQDGEIVRSEEDLLTNINELAKQEDTRIAERIANGEIDGVIYVSADPKKLNAASTKAIVDKKVPVVGTGGTAMANLQSMGANVISVSGTTGTTNRTRAISAITSFSKEFNLKYKPIIGKMGGSSNESKDERLKDRISIRGIMMASLPGFISMALILALSQIPAFAGLSDVFDIIIGVLPIIVATIAAYQISGLDEVGIVSGIIAGALSVNGGVIGGIIGGVLAGVLASVFIRLAFKWKMPGTTANIIAGGLAGLVAGLLVYFFIAPLAVMLGDGIREVIQISLDFSPVLAGVVAGALIWPAIMGGIYHAAILPIVLLEMEATGMSFLGAIDMVALVMVSAGITLGNVLFPIKKEDRAIALPGFLINVIFGTFVEASYPFMLSNKVIFAGAIISGALGGGLVGLFGVQGTAYVPSVVAPTLANNIVGMLIAMIAAMLLGVAFTYVGNRMRRKGSMNNEV